MNKKINGVRASGANVEKRGGYSSSSKVVTKLTPPPRGAAPGARPRPAASSAAKTT
jgi:hypothetical protein